MNLFVYNTLIFSQGTMRSKNSLTLRTHPSTTQHCNEVRESLGDMGTPLWPRCGSMVAGANSDPGPLPRAPAVSRSAGHSTTAGGDSSNVAPLEPVWGWGLTRVGTTAGTSGTDPLVSPHHNHQYQPSGRAPCCLTSTRWVRLDYKRFFLSWATNTFKNHFSATRYFVLELMSSTNLFIPQ